MPVGLGSKGFDGGWVATGGRLLLGSEVELAEAAAAAP